MSAKKFQYQAVVVLSSKLDETERDGVMVKVEKWAKEAGVEGFKKAHFGTKSLVYKIRKEDKGDFWTINLESDKPVSFKEFSLYLNREVNIIRYLVLKQE